MDFHPITAHFPIALLTVYVFLECVRFKKLLANQTFFYIKAFLVIAGVLASYAAYVTGDALEKSFANNPQRNILELHQQWAVATIATFSLVALYYLIDLMERHVDIARFTETPFGKKLWSVALFFRHSIGKPAIIVILALLGLGALTITGALGGSIVYGPDVDPVVKFIYLFIAQ